MDTHIAGDPTLDNASTLRPRLPGEPEPGFEEALPDPPLRAGGRTVSPTQSAPRSRHRGALLSGVALLGVVVMVGGAFLVSPYNKVVPIPRGVRLAALHAETRVALLWHQSGNPQRADGGGGRTSAATPAPVVHRAMPAAPAAALSEPLAPSAALAAVHPAAPPAAVVRPPYKPPPQGQELAEVLELGKGVAAGSTIPPAAKAAPLHPPPVGHPAAPATTAAPVAASGTPAGHPPHPSGTAPSTALAPAAPPANKVADGTATGPHAGAPGVKIATVSSTPAGAAVDKGVTPTPATTPDPTVKSSPAPATPPKATTVASPAPLVHLAMVTPSNALRAATELHAAPMSSDQQVQVLELVTQLATLIRDERTEIGDLQVNVRKSEGSTSAKLADFERRLALLEAGSALNAASNPPTPSGAGAAAAKPAGPGQASEVPAALASAKMALAGASKARPSARPAGASTPSVGGQGSSAGPLQYHVQAASPGLAMLAQVDRGGGDGAQLQVQVGDTIPGYGRVLSVEQQGTNWAVRTEHGTIR
ncbi:MAG: hypothetical protein J0H19_01260 [Rhodospirillales bacterium]|nr:hypothetical protein [Rhodospirillales bacterium]